MATGYFDDDYFVAPRLIKRGGKVSPGEKQRQRKARRQSRRRR